MKKCKLLITDLDGTLIETVSGDTFPKGIWDMKIKPDVFEAIKNYAPDDILIISNQGFTKPVVRSSFILELHQTLNLTSSHWAKSIATSSYNHVPPPFSELPLIFITN